VHNRGARPAMRYVHLRGRSLLLPRASVWLGISSRSRWHSAPLVNVGLAAGGPPCVDRAAGRSGGHRYHLRTLSMHVLADTATAGTSHRKDADST
jgi:hypothetical protein